jgi:hypothetical protein
MPCQQTAAAAAAVVVAAAAAAAAAAADCYCYMFERNLDTGLPSASNKKHWRGVLQRLALSEEQVTSCYLFVMLFVVTHVTCLLCGNGTRTLGCHQPAIHWRSALSCCTVL